MNLPFFYLNIFFSPIFNHHREHKSSSYWTKREVNIKLTNWILRIIMQEILYGPKITIKKNLKMKNLIFLCILFWIHNITQSYRQFWSCRWVNWLHFMCHNCQINELILAKLWWQPYREWEWLKVIREMRGAQCLLFGLCCQFHH